MSDTSSLTELARFIGRSKPEAEPGQRAANAAAAVVARPKRQPHSVGDLLSVVLVLSARTRRVVLPRVEIDIDVFSPSGGRAVRMFLPR